MWFQREKQASLLKWKNSSNRKPLVIRGARQVGKTALVKEFSKEYEQKIFLNLEKLENAAYFEKYTDVKTLLNALLLEKNIEDPLKKETLIFIDEIQESTRAIQLLRYFYEEFPYLHVIAAGSLLEHSLRNVKSFPVGRIEYLYLFPFNFREYLMAHGKSLLLEKLSEIPIDSATYGVAMKWFHRYALIGGMPEAVSADVGERSFSDINRIYESIWASYTDDVVKYAQNRTEEKIIKHIIRTAPLHLDQRVTFHNFGSSNYKSREVGESFRSLDDAKIVELLYPTTSIEPPIIADFRKSPRMQFLDTGLLNHAIGIQSQLLQIEDLSTSFKGSLLPHLINQELTSLNEHSYNKLSFWVRQKKSSQAEVDLVYNFKSWVIPIEIKSGPAGKLRSLQEFINRAPHQYAIRIYGGEFSIENHQTTSGKKYKLLNLPYFLATYLELYLEYLTNEENHPS